jgi:AraC-like DNA-binding protein
MQQFLRFSTDTLPERDRIAIWNEVYGRYILSARFDAIDGVPFAQSATLRSLPGLSLASMSCSAFRGWRTRSMLTDGDERLRIVINVAGTGKFQQLGREAVLGPHDAVLLSNTEDVFTHYPDYPDVNRAMAIAVPRQALAPVLGNPDNMLCQMLPRSEVLRLLVSYVQSTNALSLDSPGLGQAFANHLQDLMALAIGANRDGEELARGRGLRAARLAAIKVDIGRSLGRRDLSISALAQRHGVTSRYIQKLFESDGTTFTEYLVEQRLLEARRLLGDPAFADHGIGDIALRAGFGDLPYFTRSFRRRFGITPSDAREQARRDSHGADDTDS